MAKREENPLLNTFQFRCGDLSNKDVSTAAHYLFLKRFKSLSKEVNLSVDFSEYELVSFYEIFKL